MKETPQKTDNKGKKEHNVQNYAGFVLYGGQSS